MKPRLGRLSDLKSKEPIPEMNNNNKDNGSTKAAILVTVTLLIASNVGLILYVVKQQQRINELLLANRKDASGKTQA